MIKKYNQLKYTLRIFLSIVAILLVIGSIFVYSSSSVYALETFGSAHYFIKRQLIGLLLGVIAIIVMQYIPSATLKKTSLLLFIGAIVLTSLTLIPGLTRHIHGSSRWLNLGGFIFQPSELLKITFIMYLAFFLERKGIRHTSLRNYLPLVLILGVPAIILLKQPDFGLTVTLLLTTLIMLFIAQCSLKYIALFLCGLLPLGMALILIRPYRLQRVLTFLNPWQDPQGSGFQVIQSLIAIGSGGLWGIGIGNSKQKFFYLPMQCTDFIFAIIAEETGFIGALFLITLYLLFLYFGIRIATMLNTSFAFFTTIGFTILISFQAFINITVATGLAPTKGIGLPFISYGNTALICSLIMIGIIMRLVQEQTH